MYIYIYIYMYILYIYIYINTYTHIIYTVRQREKGLNEAVFVQKCPDLRLVLVRSLAVVALKTAKHQTSKRPLHPEMAGASMEIPSFNFSHDSRVMWTATNDLL